MSGAYYNENDPKMAAWLRQLVENNVITAGDVDERSIEDVRPSDLRGFRQCHFFAGIGGWAAALRLARWPIDREVWTGSCPCQPFSAAGERAGFADERHLWPAWFHLIEECRPTVVFGEQVDAGIKQGWLDLVQSDMEGIGYAFAPTAVPAASVGTPHGRHRLWFVADAGGSERKGWRGPKETRLQLAEQYAADHRGIGSLEYSDLSDEHARAPSGQQPLHVECDASAGKTAGFWRNADWIPCSDGKWRPIEPGVFPLAHGVQARMDKLRGFGNAIVPQVAAQFVSAYMSCA